MARRRRHKNYTTKTLKRDVLTVASLPARLLERAISPVLSPIETIVTGSKDLIDDWRNWSPEPRTRRPKTFSGTTPVIKTSRTATSYGFTQHFAAPQAVIQCVRRHRRREVLHALRKAGKRGKKGPYRRSMWSEVKC